MSDCFNNIIALSQNECPCPGYQPDGGVVPLSGIYLDKLPGLDHIVGSLISTLKCGEENVYKIFDNCLEEAGRMVINDMIMCIKDKNDLRPEFKSSHYIGNKFDYRTHSLSKKYAVVSLFFKEIKCGKLCFEEIGFLPFKGAPTKDLTIYDQYGCVVETYNFKTDEKVPVKIQFGTTGEKTVQPFCIDLEECKELHFVYENCGVDPKFNESWCGCKGKTPPWFPFVNIQSTQSNFDPQDPDSFLKLINEPCATPRALFGLCFKMKLSCDYASTLCDITPEDDKYTLLAYAIAYKTVDLLLSKIIQSRKINYETLVDKEVLMGVRNQYRSWYNSQMFGDDNVVGLCSCLKDCGCFSRSGTNKIKMYDS